MRRARQHTSRFLGWWNRAGIAAADLAIRRRKKNVWIWHRDLSLARLPLDWARYENARGSEVYIRPARGHAWPLVFVDDVEIGAAERVLRSVSAMAVHTSLQGGCQLWIHCEQDLDERQRHLVQRRLVRRLQGDPGSASGEHMGRLAGFKNLKRSGVWVNVHGARFDLPALNAIHLATEDAISSERKSPGRRYGIQCEIDISESAREWGWVCGALEAGMRTEDVYRALVERARPRRAKDAERYARRTVEKAMKHTRASLPLGVAVVHSRRGQIVPL